MRTFLSENRELVAALVAIFVGVAVRLLTDFFRKIIRSREKTPIDTSGSIKSLVKKAKCSQEDLRVLLKVLENHPQYQIFFQELKAFDKGRLTDTETKKMKHILKNLKKFSGASDY